MGEELTFKKIHFNTTNWVDENGKRYVMTPVKFDNYLWQMGINSGKNNLSIDYPPEGSNYPLVDNIAKPHLNNRNTIGIPINFIGTKTFTCLENRKYKITITTKNSSGQSTIWYNKTVNQVGSTPEYETTFYCCNVLIEFFVNGTKKHGLNTLVYHGDNMNGYIPIVFSTCEDSILLDSPNADRYRKYLGIYIPQPIGNWTGRNVSTHQTKNEFLSLVGGKCQYYGTPFLLEDDDLKDVGDNKPQGKTNDDEDSGGDGIGTRQNDDITDDELPDTPAMDFISAYNPTSQQLKDLSAFMWSNNFFDNILKNQTSPMENIISLHSIPIDFAVNNTCLKVGGVDTGIICSKLSKQFYNINMGSVSLSKFWGSALDYAPYTKMDIYLPFIGTVPLNVDDVMGNTISVDYNIDILSGECVARVNLPSKILAMYRGNCATRIPISCANYSNMFSNLIGGGIGIATGMAVAGATGGVGAVASGGVASAVGSAINTAMNVVNGKPQTSYSNGLGGAVSGLSVPYPYIIVHAPVQSLPKDYADYIGFPSNITVTLSDCTGYTEVEEIHLKSNRATENELIEIEKLLKSGVTI